MLEYMIGTTRRNGKSLRYLRIKSDAEIGLTGDLVTFTQTQEDKVSVYEVIVGDLLREESGDGLFYRWYEVESVLVETDHTPQLAAEVEDMAQATVAASIVFTVMAEAGQIDDTTAAENASQFAEWAYPVAVTECFQSSDLHQLLSFHFSDHHPHYIYYKKNYSDNHC